MIRHANYPLSRWKNGAGETREIARHPETGEFDWRLSMATVAVANDLGSTDFSAFPGIERWLGVAAGGALAVTIDGVERELGIGGKALRFSGSAPASAHPLEGPVTDVNLMVREGVCEGELTTLAPGDNRFDRGELLIVSLVDRLILRVAPANADPFEVTLGHLDTWYARLLQPSVIEVGGAAHSVSAYAAQIRPVG